ncbi:hypothetical protein PHJA_002870100, partial [Phtheirospermum japonicum]
KHLRLWIFECKEPRHDAFVLGLAAATLLGIAHVLANLLGGCSACTQEEIEKASPSKQLAMACLCFHLDHPSRWFIDAGDWNNIEPQIKNVVRFHTSPFPVDRRDIVYGSRPLFRSILCHCHFRTCLIYI